MVDRGLHGLVGILDRAACSSGTSEHRGDDQNEEEGDGPDDQPPGAEPPFVNNSAIRHWLFPLFSLPSRGGKAEVMRPQGGGSGTNYVMTRTPAIGSSG